MEWKDFEAVIPAVMSMPKRADSVRELLKDLGRQCPGIKVHIMPQWYEETPNWRDVFVTISRGLQNLTSPWILYLEDDAELAPDFGELAMSDIKSVHDECGAISFFSDREIDQLIYRGQPKMNGAILPFINSQGLAIRKEVADLWGQKIVDWWDRATKHKKKAPDMALGDICYEAGYEILIRLPSIVQHRKIPSAFGHTHHPHSKTFGK
jgi:hypothetical protein